MNKEVKIVGVLFAVMLTFWIGRFYEQKVKHWKWDDCYDEIFSYIKSDKASTAKYYGFKEGTILGFNHHEAYIDHLQMDCLLGRRDRLTKPAPDETLDTN